MSVIQDKRVERTKKDLKSSFIDLLQRYEDIEKITVTEIVDYANYNRGTFYAHFSSKEEILNEIMEDMINGFITAFREPYKSKKDLYFDSLSANTIKLFQYVETNKSIFSLLFNKRKFPGLQLELAYAVSEVFNELVYTNAESYKLNKKLHNRMEAGMLISMLDYWIETEYSQSAEYMNEQLISYAKSRFTNVNPTSPVLKILL